MFYDLVSTFRLVVLIFFYETVHIQVFDNLRYTIINGEAVEQWADSCDLTLIHDAKLPNNPSTVQDGRKATTQISSFHLEASQTCVRSQSWTISHTSNTAQSVLVPTQSWYHKLYLSDDVLTLRKQTGMDTQLNSISLLKTLNLFQPNTTSTRVL